jgi:hypothetical protein
LIHELSGCQKVVDFLTKYQGVRGMRIELNSRKVGKGDIAGSFENSARYGVSLRAGLLFATFEPIAILLSRNAFIYTSLVLLANHRIVGKEAQKKKEIDGIEWKTEEITCPVCLHVACAVTLLLSDTYCARGKLVEFDYDKGRHQYRLQSGYARPTRYRGSFRQHASNEHALESLL